MINTINTQLIAALTPLRVLIVDDSPVSRRILEVFLSRLGHSVFSARDGDEALKIFAHERPDLVILDVLMPGMDGYEVARLIRAGQGEQWMPIVFLSALDREEDIINGFAAGCDDFIAKPFSFALLEAKLRSLQRALALQRLAIGALTRVRAISDAIVDAIVTIDVKETIVAANSACEMIFGWTPEEMIGRNLRLLMPEPFRSRHAGHVADYVHGGPPHIIGVGRESLGLRRDGTIFPIDLAVSEVRIDQQRLFVGVIRDISERKEAERKRRESAELLQRYYDEAEAEAQLVRDLIERQLQRPGLDDSLLSYWMIPAQNFSGDIVAATRSPLGHRYALLADATGHGLTAAISALPVLSLFYSMAPAGAPLADIVGEINHQLRQSMPVGRFVAATLVRIDEASGEGEIWVGGVPDALLLDADGRVRERFSPQKTALGVIESDDWIRETRRFAWTPRSQLLLCSDGLLEATDARGDVFGEERLFAAVAGVAAADRHGAVRAALARHLGEAAAHDDISLMLIDCP
jgi:PAS domain S-box-containing protein